MGIKGHYLVGRGHHAFSRSHSSYTPTATKSAKRRVMKAAVKTPVKKSRSYTKTKTKPKTKDVSDDLQKGISSFNVSIVVNKPHKVGVVKGSAMRYSDCLAGFVVGGEGIQAVSPITYIGSISQTMVPSISNGYIGSLGYGFSQLGTPTPSTNPVFITMNPNEVNTGSAFIGTVIEPASDLVYLKNCVVKIDVSNLATVDTVVDVYCLRNKLYIPAGKSPVDIWNSTLANERLGYLDEGKYLFGGTAATVGNLASFHPDSRPGTNRAFNSFYKVLAVRRLKLSGGSCELLSFDLKMNLLIDVNKLIALQSRAGSWTNASSTWLAAGMDVDGLKGGVSFMTVQRGTPVDDVTANNVSLGATKIGFNVIRKYELKYVKGNAARLSTELAYDNLVTNTAIASQKIVNIVDTAAAVVNG